VAGAALVRREGVDELAGAGGDAGGSLREVDLDAGVAAAGGQDDAGSVTRCGGQLVPEGGQSRLR